MDAATDAAKVSFNGPHYWQPLIAVAHKATELNPSYTKAWGRLATARTVSSFTVMFCSGSLTPTCICSFQGLGDLRRAIEAWQRALASLPVENPTLAERQQRVQCSSELAAAKQRLRDFETNFILPTAAVLRYENGEDLPWERARAIIATLNTLNSCVSSAVYRDRLSS